VRLLSKYRPSPGLIVGFLALVVALGGVAYAAIPSADGTITACVQQSVYVRIIDAEAGQRCLRWEKTIRWQDGTQVGDADTLDGKDSTEFLGATAKAADSELLDGLDSSDLREACPAGMDRSANLCIGPHQSGTWGDGYYACLNAGKRLPNAGEAGTIALYLLIQGASANEALWTSDMTAGNTAMIGSFTAPNFFDLLERPLTDALEYRCVATPGQPAGAGLAAGRSRSVEVRPQD
jgi:hypothetical protein